MALVRQRQRRRREPRFSLALAAIAVAGMVLRRLLAARPEPPVERPEPPAERPEPPVERTAPPPVPTAKKSEEEVDAATIGELRAELRAELERLRRAGQTPPRQPDDER